MSKSTQNKTNNHFHPVPLLVSKVFLPHLISIPTSFSQYLLLLWLSGRLGFLLYSRTEPIPGSLLILFISWKCCPPGDHEAHCVTVSCHCDKSPEGATDEREVLLWVIILEIHCAPQVERHGSMVPPNSGSLWQPLVYIVPERKQRVSATMEPEAGKNLQIHIQCHASASRASLFKASMALKPVPKAGDQNIHQT